jgi:acyl carrier protein
MLERQSIRRALVQLLEEEMGEQYPDLDDAKKLREELGLDSVDVVSLVSQVERRYHVRLTTEQLQELVTVGDVLNLLVVKLNAPLPPQQKAA